MAYQSEGEGSGKKQLSENSQYGKAMMRNSMLEMAAAKQKWSSEEKNLNENNVKNEENKIRNT